MIAEAVPAVGRPHKTVLQLPLKLSITENKYQPKSQEKKKEKENLFLKEEWVGMDSFVLISRVWADQLFKIKVHRLLVWSATGVLEHLPTGTGRVDVSFLALRTRSANSTASPVFQWGSSALYSGFCPYLGTTEPPSQGRQSLLVYTVLQYFWSHADSGAITLQHFLFWLSADSSGFSSFQQ